MIPVNNSRQSRFQILVSLRVKCHLMTWQEFFTGPSVLHHKLPPLFEGNPLGMHRAKGVRRDPRRVDVGREGRAAGGALGGVVQVELAWVET